jgi:hypothetical protein
MVNLAAMGAFSSFAVGCGVLQSVFPCALLLGMVPPSVISLSSASYSVVLGWSSMAGLGIWGGGNGHRRRALSGG